MPPKIRYFNINWENGMKISKEHFIQQENAIYDRLKDVYAIFLNNRNYGLLPVDTEAENSIKRVFKIDNQNYLKVKIFQCRAITLGGIRIEILEDHLLPELEVSLSKELENSAKGEGGDYYILLSADIFNRQTFGALVADEEPPRFPYSIPTYKASIIPESQVINEGIQPTSLIIGKIAINIDKPQIYEDYIPPCMVVNSHLDLIAFFNLTEKFFGKLELDLISIIKKIKEKGQDSKLALSVLSLSQELLRFVSENHLRLHWEISDLPPVYLFEYIASSARVIRNSIDTITSSKKEELLNYFTNWSELKQGDFEKLLVNCINFEYHHSNIGYNIDQFGEFIQIISMLFDKLESLAYIGKKKGTNIFVKEQKTKRSFLVD